MHANYEAPQIEERFYTKRDMARRYGVSPLTIWRWVKAKKIPPGTYINQKSGWAPEKVRQADEMLLSAEHEATGTTK